MILVSCQPEEPAEPEEPGDKPEDPEEPEDTRIFERGNHDIRISSVGVVKF